MNSKSVFAAVMVTIILGTTTIVFPSYAQAQVCNPLNYVPGCRPAEAPDAAIKLIVNKAKPLFGVDLPLGRESSTFIQNVTQLAKEGFDSPQNAKLFLQLDSIALNS